MQVVVSSWVLVLWQGTLILVWLVCILLVLDIIGDTFHQSVILFGLVIHMHVALTCDFNMTQFYLQYQ